MLKIMTTAALVLGLSVNLAAQDCGGDTVIDPLDPEGTTCDAPSDTDATPATADEIAEVEKLLGGKKIEDLVKEAEANGGTLELDGEMPAGLFL